MMKSAPDMFLRRFLTIGRLAVRWPDGGEPFADANIGPGSGSRLGNAGACWSNGLVRICRRNGGPALALRREGGHNLVRQRG